VNVACACFVSACGSIGVFIRVFACVHVRDHVCVLACSCRGHVGACKREHMLAHVSVRVQVMHFRSPTVPDVAQIAQLSSNGPVPARCR
jgi:hypothetical protein